jgi:hypothetical protein
MEVTVGTVVDGKVVIEGAHLPEGTRVTVLVQDELDVALSTAEKELLARSAEQAERGLVIDAWDLLRDIKKQR